MKSTDTKTALSKEPETKEKPADSGDSFHRIVRLSDITESEWPDKLPPETEYYSLLWDEWIQDYAGNTPQEACEALSWSGDVSGKSMIRFPFFA